MRFGSRSHTSDEPDAKMPTERDRLVRTLRHLADTIEATPAARINAGLAGMTAAAEALVRTVERTLGRR